jgi:opacity protein-like surface antigen
MIGSLPEDRSASGGRRKTMKRHAQAFALSLVVAAGALSPAGAGDSDSLFGTRTASVTVGPYIRMELGSSKPSLGGAYWRPPGYDPAPGVGDPEVRFDLGADSGTVSTVAFGHDWQGWRADVSLSYFGTSTAAGPCASASDSSSCALHAEIDRAPFSSAAILGNVFYAPLEARGSHSVFQPFVVAGIGVARNEVGDWTRSNPSPTATRPTRTFAGDTSTSLAWSLGLGASYQITRPGRWPMLLEASWRYYDLGTASGGFVPLAGSGGSEPVQPLTFDATQSVFAIGLRIPLERY